MKITTIGIDLAKVVFQIHGVDMHGKALLRKQLRRNNMTKFFANLDPCLIGMEACGSSHQLGEKAGRIWAYRQTHVTPVRQTLCEDQQA